MLPAADRLALRRTIAVATNKGGVGKTSIVANVSGLLAEAGYRVLAVDLDSQSNLGEDLGYTSTGTDDGQGLFEAVTTRKPLQPLKAVRPGLDVVPAGEYLEDLATTLDGRRSRHGETATLESLAVSLAPIASRYDVIMIDCPPKGRILQEIALAAARWLIIPTKSDASSRKAIAHIAQRFLAARDVNPDVDLLGVVLFGSGSGATRLRQDILKEIAADLQSSEPLFDAVIRHAEKPAVQARLTGRLIHELEQDKNNAQPWYVRLRERADGQEPTGPGPIAASVTNLAGDYQKLAEEIVQRLAAAEERAAAQHNEGQEALS
jgi:chromosome partitioning protein